jgi:DNA (cytosine-5)-methyltransferase 1
LSIYELMLLSGIPGNWKIPKWASDNLIRKVIGECFPPKFCEHLIKTMPRNSNG